MAGVELTKQIDYPFLKGGGEMGKLTRNYHWQDSPLGDPGIWPQSLKTTLSIILNSKFPMFLFWGPQLICFYNDAYRPSLGQHGKHPSILGMPAEQAWPEIWNVIKPLIDKAIKRGQATWSEDQLIPIYRNGKMEDVYWTFSYSPVSDESGNPAGVFVTSTETTGKIMAYQQLEASNRQLISSMETDLLAQRKIRENERNLRQIILQAPAAIAIFRGPQYVVEIVNPRALELWGRKSPEVLNKPILAALPELESQGVKELLDSVYQTGKPFSGTELPIQLLRKGQLETTYINFVYEPLYDSDGIINGLITIGTDVTTQVLARKIIEESEERFRTMAEGTAVLIGVADDTGYAVYFNTAWVKLTGRPVKDLIQSGWVDLIHPEDRQSFLDIYWTSFKTRTSFTCEFKILSTDGNYRWLLVNGLPRLTTDGVVAGYISSSIDITERKEAETEIRKLATIIEASTELIGLTSLDTSIKYMNPTGLQKLGWDAFEGRKIIDCVYPEDREFAEDMLPELSEKGRFHHEIRFWNERTGVPFWIVWNGFKVTDLTTGKMIGLATVSPDITERKLDEMRKNDFIGMVSHELKTPLTSLTAYVQMLHARSMKSEDKFSENALDKVNTQVTKMRNMINGFLNVSRLESGKIYLEKQDFDLYDLVMEMIEETKLTISSHTIIFTYGESITVNADRDKIGSVISNLLSNAVKYSPKSKIIEVRCEVIKNNAQLSVKDEGMGIKPIDIEKLFDRYYRVETAHTRHISGFGIGLYLSAEIIQRHEGKIWVESESGVGSVFYISLPLS